MMVRRRWRLRWGQGRRGVVHGEARVVACVVVRVRGVCRRQHWRATAVQQQVGGGTTTAHQRGQMTWRVGDAVAVMLRRRMRRVLRRRRVLMVRPRRRGATGAVGRWLRWQQVRAVLVTVVARGGVAVTKRGQLARFHYGVLLMTILREGSSATLDKSQQSTPFVH